jgi:hypothetical protein
VTANYLYFCLRYFCCFHLKMDSWAQHLIENNFIVKSVLRVPVFIFQLFALLYAKLC